MVIIRSAYKIFNKGKAAMPLRKRLGYMFYIISQNHMAEIKELEAHNLKSDK